MDLTRIAFAASLLAPAYLVAAEEEVTFTKHIAPVVFNQCTACHRPGEAAPFSFMDYDSVKRRAKTILAVVEDRVMPPFPPDEGWGTFHNTRRLDEPTRALFRRWVEAGTPEGNPADLPPMPKFPEGWFLGEPDLIVEMDEAFEVPAEGNDIYRYFALPLNLTEDKWVKAVEVRPSARSVVHHMLFYLDNTGKSRELEAADPKPGFPGKGFKATGSLGGWAVGGMPNYLNKDFALPLAKGSDLIIQTHFHPSGKVEKEKTRIGLYFADQAPSRRLIEFQVPPGFGASVGLTVGPGEPAYEINDYLVLPEDIELAGVWGHAHQICKSMECTATLPDGSSRKLFRISDWKFNWQGQYQYAGDVALPKGTRIAVKLVYDNSASNPSNPNLPPRRIFWGEQSNDEMGSLIFQCVAADKSREGALAQGLGNQAKDSNYRFAKTRREVVRLHGVLRLDSDHDDRVSFAETPPPYHPHFKQLDQNASGYVEADEVFRFGAFLDTKK